MIRQKKEKRTIKGYGSAANRFDVTFVCDLFIFKEKQRQMLIQKLYCHFANVYICTGEDFISLQLVSYPFVLFCMTIKYV
jgi:hypothetical protein